MPLFRVSFEQWVQEIAEIQIEAESAEAALHSAYERERAGELDLDWSDGNSTRDCEITGVGPFGKPDTLSAEQILQFYEEL